ncbi:hypothetical protein T484DRAFT_3631150 [Baffinella frigidus]|nr:hypothetical protein T484DRAFT_3631150 [Cryptophyta sp. CCMP2293]
MDPAEMVMAHKFHPDMYTKRSAISSLCAAATKTFCKVRHTRRLRKDAVWRFQGHGSVRDTDRHTELGLDTPVDPDMYTKRSAISSLCAAATKTFCKVRHTRRLRKDAVWKFQGHGSVRDTDRHTELGLDTPVDPDMYTKRSAISSLCAAATKTFCKVRHTRRLRKDAVWRFQGHGSVRDTVRHTELGLVTPVDPDMYTKRNAISSLCAAAAKTFCKVRHTRRLRKDAV